MSKYKRLIVSFSVSLILFVVLTLCLKFHLLVSVDTYCYYYVAKLISPATTIIMKTLSFMGDYFIYGGSLILLFVFAKKKNIPIFLTTSLATTFALNFVLKDIFERARPAINPLVIESGFSYPSAHAMVAVAFYGAIMYLIYKYVANKKLKWLFIGLIGLLILGIGFSRIYLGVHYFTDILGGFFLGSACLMTIIILFQKYNYI